MRGATTRNRACPYQSSIDAGSFWHSFATYIAVETHNRRDSMVELSRNPSRFRPAARNEIDDVDKASRRR